VAGFSGLLPRYASPLIIPEVAADRRRPRNSDECRLRAGLFRREYRRNDGVGRSCPGAQPELCTRLACQRLAQAMGRPTDIAIEHEEAALRFSRRARVGTSLAAIGRASPEPTLRRSVTEAALRDPGRSELPKPASLSRRLLRPYGIARRRTRNRHALNSSTTRNEAICGGFVNNSRRALRC